MGDRALGRLPAWGTRRVAVGLRHSEGAARRAGAAAAWSGRCSTAGRDPRERRRRSPSMGRRIPRAATSCSMQQPFGALRQGAARAAEVSRPARVSRRPAQASVRRDRAHAAAAVRRRRRRGDGRRARPARRDRAAPRADVQPPAHRATTRGASRSSASTNESMDEGWTRWIFDTYRIPFTTHHREGRRGGDLLTRSSTRSSSPTSGGADQPRALGAGRGAAARRAALGAAFVENGGTCSRSTTRPRSHRGAEAAGEERARRRAGTPISTRRARSSRVEVKRDHPIARRFTAPVPAVWFEDSPAFEITDPRAATRGARAIRPAATRCSPAGCSAAQKLNGKAALVDVKQGKDTSCCTVSGRSIAAKRTRPSADLVGDRKVKDTGSARQLTDGGHESVLLAD